MKLRVGEVEYSIDNILTRSKGHDLRALERAGITLGMLTGLTPSGEWTQLEALAYLCLREAGDLRTFDAMEAGWTFGSISFVPEPEDVPSEAPDPTEGGSSTPPADETSDATPTESSPSSSTSTPES